MKKNLSNDRGSVLMEFIMVLPIYFVLIGGAFWTGELFLARDNAFISDRLAAYHWGVRHDRDNDDRHGNNGILYGRLLMYLFGDGTIASSITQTRALHPYAWAQAVGGKVDLWVTQPSWTRVWLHGYEQIWSETLKNVNPNNVFNLELPFNTLGLSLNSRKESRNYLSFALMRTKCGEYSYRSFSPGELCYEGGAPVLDAVWYKKVYKEKFPYSSREGDRLDEIMIPDNRDDARPGKEDHDDYARFPTYVLWSQ